MFVKIIKLFLLGLIATVTAQDVVKKWHRYKFPNPRINVQKCGRTDVSYICDPDRLLEVSDANQLDTLIESVIRDTKCPCSTDSCDKGETGYKIGVALVDKIMPDAEAEGKQQSGDTNVVDQALQESMKFAYTQLVEWELGKCEEDLIIFYSRNDGVVYTMTGKTTKNKLKSAIVGEIAMNHMASFNDRKYYQGLKDMINDYKKVLEGTYVRKTSRPEEPRYQAVIGSTSSTILPGVLTSIMMAIIVILLH